MNIEVRAPDPGGIEWDNEADRREYIWQKIVEACVSAIDQITDQCGTGSEREITIIWLRVINRLLSRLAGTEETRAWIDDKVKQ